MTAATKGLPASVQARLVRHAKATGIDPNAVLARAWRERRSNKGENRRSRTAG
jgi:hypothetical protein